MRRPWFKFYPSDWRGDSGLHACSLAARGLWIELMAIMHEATPYGYLLINGKPPTNAQISQVVGAHPKTVKRLMRELWQTGVWNRDERVDGTRVIYSRRMVRDELKRQGDNHLENGNDPSGNNKQVHVIDPPDTRKKERGPTEKSKRSIIDPNPRRVGRIKAQHRIERDLLQQLGEEGYARAIEALAANPKLVDRATEAERRSPGSGVMAAMLGLRQKA